jgi:hypothetical protein
MSSNFLKISGGRLSSILCNAALVFVLSSCLDNDSKENQVLPVAYVSIYHESPNAPELDVFVDEKPVNRLEFTDYTGYLNFYTGDRNFKINPFGASNTLVDTTYNFVDGGFYSLFIVNNISNVETLMVRDSASTPAEGKAKVRFINLSPDAPAMDVIEEESTALFSAQSFKDPSEFVEVDAATESFAVKAAGTTDELVSADDINLLPGKFYTLIVRGFVNPPAGNSNALSLEVINH